MPEGIRESTEKRRRIYLVRHGDVSYFNEHGQPVRPGGVPLNEEGRRQAQSVALELARVSFDRVLSSDLPRCLETAQIVVADRSLKIEPCEALREIRPGRLAEIPMEDLEQSFLGAFSRSVNEHTRFLGGETFGSLVERVHRQLQTILEDPEWQNLLIVAHGGVNRVLLTFALGLPPYGFGALEQDPCCINILDVDRRGQFLVRLINHTPYNPTKYGLELTTMEMIFRQYRGNR